MISLSLARERIREGQMDVHVLSAGAGNDRSYPRNIAALVEVAGRPVFPQALFRAARSMCGAEHLTAFRLSGAGRAHTVLAENTGVMPVAQSRASRYIGDYWRFDPAEKVAAPPKAPCRSAKGGRWAVKTAAREIEHSSYRFDCYSSIGLDDRISISEIRGDQLMRVNFYRRRKEHFSDDEAGRILDAADLLMPLIWRHDEETRTKVSPEPLELFRIKLAAVAPKLSDREREVCTLIALGLTSEGIALQLDIGLNTVLTYRKRAYARLGISSQNELIRLILM